MRKLKKFFIGMVWGYGILACVALFVFAVVLLGTFVYDQTGSKDTTAAVLVIFVVPLIIGFINAVI